MTSSFQRHVLAIMALKRELQVDGQLGITELTIIRDIAQVQTRLRMRQSWPSNDLAEERRLLRSDEH